MQKYKLICGKGANVNKNKLEWYAFIHDFNDKKLARINVLNEKEIREWIKRDKVTNFEELRECVKSILMYHYWSRSEYEVAVASLFVKEPSDYFKGGKPCDFGHKKIPL